MNGILLMSLCGSAFYPPSFLTHGGKIGVQTEQFRPMGKDKRQKLLYTAKWLEMTNYKGQERKR